MTAVQQVSEADRFYERRDARTVAYLDAVWPVHAPIEVYVGDDACATQAGQLALLTLVNQLMRFHRVVSVYVERPATALLTPAVRGGSSLGEELVGLAAAIDPYGQFDLRTSPAIRRRQSLSASVGSAAAVSVGTLAVIGPWANLLLRPRRWVKASVLTSEGLG